MFLAVLLPASWYNYGQKDIVLSTQLQVLLNCAVIILSATVSNWLSDAPATAPDIKVLKYFALSLLLLAGVLVPGIFTVVWLFVAGGLLTVEQSQEISFANIAALSSVVSALLSWLVFARDRKKADAVEPPIKIYR